MVAESPDKDQGLESIPLLVDELKITPRQIIAVARLLGEGNTIPFIARYRKEIHGNLDEVQIGKIQERLAYHREMEERRSVVLRSIEDQGKLTDALKVKLLGAKTKTELEDLYLPFKPKRRTRAMIAREKGLEPLAQQIRDQAVQAVPATEAGSFVNAEKGVATSDEALAGARDIVAEWAAEDAEIRGMIRQAYATEGVLASEVVEPKPAEPTKFEQYYDFKEKVSTIPSHRFLAIRRGQNEGVLRCKIGVEAEPLVRRMTAAFKMNPGSPWAPHLALAMEDAYKRLLSPSVEVDVTVELKMKADRAAVEIFAQNLRNLLLSAPLGEKSVIGIDPGLRTGCKCTALDATGKFLSTTVIYPSQGDRKETEARVELFKFVQQHKPFAIAVGNGTGGRETEAFVRETLAKGNIKDVLVISVSESGASVYSASEVAREEFPDLDLTIRGAISIGRRLQDPLAELVKIDPKSIGVGQYQHDVHQPLLAQKLEDVVVSCVNHVGVELNTASAPLLARVSGIGASMAKKIVETRNTNGAFKNRKQLLKVPGMGPKTYEQAAGFLRIRGSENPLDASAVHPERYTLVESMAADLKTPLPALLGNGELADKIDIRKYVSETVGEPTLRDIVAELKKPGRDPRAVFEKPAFLDGVTEIEHLKAGMLLEGIVTNVTAFGAFVDIGVHQDGLVHISELSDRYVSDPADVVKAGDKLKVRVLDVDAARKRIALSARTQPRAPKGSSPAPGAGGPSSSPNRPGAPRTPPPPPRNTFNNNPFGNL
jgi:uncharacterized protein